jgi:anthranilate phosphoribosyltransferase
MVSAQVEIVSALRAGERFSVERASDLCELLLDGALSDHEGADILVALAERGETPEEVCGFARVLLSHAAPVPFEGSTVDTCGTGGSGLVRFNTSTAVAFVVAAAGVRVAKHGNRGSRRPNGSFDLLEALGIPVALDGPRVAECLAETGLGFLLAPRFHPVMKHVVVARKLAARRTIFNLVAPLCNPTRVAHQVVGTASERDARTISRCLELLGRRNFCCVTGHPGQDEVSISGPSSIYGLEHAPVETLEPHDHGLEPVAFDTIPGGDAAVNALLLGDLFRGRAPRSIEDLVGLSAALLLRTAGTVGSIRVGLELARELLRSGQVQSKFEQYRRVALRLGA